jgi:hypothetical protein
VTSPGGNAAMTMTQQEPLTGSIRPAYYRTRLGAAKMADAASSAGYTIRLRGEWPRAAAHSLSSAGAGISGEVSVQQWVQLDNPEGRDATEQREAEAHKKMKKHKWKRSKVAAGGLAEVPR